MTFQDPTFWIITGSCVGMVLVLLRVVWRMMKYRRQRLQQMQLVERRSRVTTTRSAPSVPITTTPTMRDIYFKTSPPLPRKPTPQRRLLALKRVFKHIWRAHVALATIIILVIVTTVVVAHASKTATSVAEPTPEVAQGWYNQAWPHRVTVTVKHAFVEEDVTDFPVLVKIQGANNPIFADSPKGQDLVFTSNDGVTKLPYDLEQYNADTKELVAWVKVPKLSMHQDTLLYLYYGNPNALVQAEPQAVWTNGYAAVYNVADSATAPVANAVKAPNDPTYRATYGDATVVPGKVGQALELNGPTDVVDIQGAQPGDSSNVVPPMTISAWIKPQSKAGTIVGKRDLTSTQWQFFTTDNGILNLKEDETGHWPGHQSFGTPATSITVGDWQYVAMTIDGSGTPTFYNNGTSEVGRYQNGTFLAHPVNAAIGARWLNYPTTDYSLNGDIDTIRLATVARSAGWIKTEYANQAYTTAFLTISDQPENQ